MRIARGLLRLWLVLSVLWIGGVGVVTWPQVPIFDRSMPFSFEEAPRFPVPADYDPFSKSSYLIAWARDDAPVALIPPLLVLAIGSALGWAIKGFKVS
jgi:hypothetical protein